MKIKLNPGILSGLLIILLGSIYYFTQITISNAQKDKLQNIELPLDNTILDKREAGNINLNKFTGLISNVGGNNPVSLVVTQNKDSILILKPSSWSIEKFRRVFYNDRETGKWEKLYQNLPIRTFETPEYGFAARIDSVDHKLYIYLPYEILFSVARHAYNETGKITIPQDSIKSVPPSKITVRPNDAEEIIAAKKGNLIQTEGIIWKHVSELIAKADLKNSSKIEQLCYLWKYAKDNWVYINDPISRNKEDTWRSASETIETYYFDNTNKYTGDCDDFAILMASFSRQVGLESRFIGAYGAEGGHAYAEFFVPDASWSSATKTIGNVNINYMRGDEGNWVNLDWWADHVGGEYFAGSRTIYDL